MADEAFKKTFLETHNTFRAMHQAPPLTYNDDLCSNAQKWAESLLKKNTMAHSDTSDGENIFYSFSSRSLNLLGNEAVDSWYNEIENYEFNKPGFQSGTGHFTQVVWKETKELGMGMATDGNTVFVVGQYRPAGNINNSGYFEQNVLPKDP